MSRGQSSGGPVSRGSWLWLTGTLWSGWSSSCNLRRRSSCLWSWSSRSFSCCRSVVTSSRQTSDDWTHSITTVLLLHYYSITTVLLQYYYRDLPTVNHTKIIVFWVYSNIKKPKYYSHTGSERRRWGRSVSWTSALTFSLCYFSRTKTLRVEVTAVDVDVRTRGSVAVSVPSGIPHICSRSELRPKTHLILCCRKYTTYEVGGSAAGGEGGEGGGEWVSQEVHSNTECKAQKKVESQP